MKSLKSVLLIIIGILLFTLGCALGGNGGAMFLSMIGGFIILLGLLPLIENSNINLLSIQISMMDTRGGTCELYLSISCRINAMNFIDRYII